MTMREKLIEVALTAGDGKVGLLTVARIIDAILTTLREPDEGMEIAGGQCEPFDTAVVGKPKWTPGRIVASECFTAMIDHIRSGK